jgi:hypothetical protein
MTEVISNLQCIGCEDSIPTGYLCSKCEEETCKYCQSFIPGVEKSIDGYCTCGNSPDYNCCSGCDFQHLPPGIDKCDRCKTYCETCNNNEENCECEMCEYCNEITLIDKRDGMCENCYELDPEDRQTPLNLKFSD